jgi:DNA repair exonuclease SbcCD ATPase subunit
VEGTPILERMFGSAGGPSRARMARAAIRAAGQDSPVADAARALHQALLRGFQSSVDGEKVRASYERQSGLVELLKQRAESAKPEDLRDALKRERDLLESAFGTDEKARAGLSAAEESYRRARDARSQAETKLAEARAHKERASHGQKRAQELEAKVAGLEDAMAPISQDTAVHEESLKLLDDLTLAMKTRFGPGIARYIESLLPRLTLGRYRRTRIDPDLEIRVFSSERGDYVRLIDLSFGTADQVLLALRLGLARAMVASRGLAGAHFLFLDEPLATADEERGNAFLELLKTFDESFAQVFVTSARPIEGDFARRITVESATKALAPIE